jgi:hypothetical protein
MNGSKLGIKILGLFSLVLAAALFSGCAGSTARPGRNMAAISGIPGSPPAGKTLVFIHCPKTSLYVKLNTGIWDGTNFIGGLGNGYSTAYICEPGEHYFMNLSVEITACVEAQLLPDKTYDLWVDTYRGMFVTSYKLKPLQQDDKTRRRVAKWSGQNLWVEPGSSAGAYERAKQDDIRRLLEEFISGPRHNKLQHMAPDDHR